MTASHDPITSGAIDPRDGSRTVMTTPRPATHRSPQRRRTWFRAVHLLAGVVLGTYVYAPAAVAQPLQLALQFVVVPAIVLSGLFMWKQAQIRRLMRRRNPTR